MINVKIDGFHRKDLENEEHPSIFFRHEDYDLFIVRLPLVSKEDDIAYKSFSFVITENNYFYYNKESKEFEELQNMRGFYKFLDKLADGVLSVSAKFVTEIDGIEDKIYQGKVIDDFNKRWFVLKSDLIRINRLLNKATDVLSLLVRSYKTEDDFLVRNFEDISEHLHRAYRNAGLMLEKLDSMYNFNLNQTNEQMNRIVYILTLLSGIFLPLNLIVGFFGMNTTSLPFTKIDGGTYMVVIVLVASSILATLLLLFMKKRW